ncbi:hypothetical protein [Ohtaekwangia koreensis]|uniref:hypothetical protein n=1 Tax=Ohtaekwangia koreensis TaxID=688867 RepID=UPI001356679B|nr:hypothetical protein [Ohtaekwangia koreensis]
MNQLIVFLFQTSTSFFRTFPSSRLPDFATFNTSTFLSFRLPDFTTLSDFPSLFTKSQ